MSMLQLLSEESSWKQFYRYKSSLAVRQSFESELSSFIEKKTYLPICERIIQCQSFPLPSKAIINKSNSQKKRTVYLYPKAETTVLKLLTYLLLRKYNSLFCDNLYSFRPGRTAKDAVRKFASRSDLRTMYFYKADISNYFNSIPVSILTEQLQDVLREDQELLVFLCRLLEEPHVSDKGRIVTEKKGIMAGTPLSAFYANLYLRDLDQWFFDRDIPYARYSDDIIVFADTSHKVREYAALIRDFLALRQLKMNPKKECFGTPDSGWTFLGFSCKGSIIDIAPVTVQKIKAKMRRKAKALQRWRQRNDIDGEKAAAAFIRIFNRKLLESPEDHELSWSCWFFSVINTDASLKVIDNYAQDCLRFLISGTRRKSRYQVRYEQLKDLGYRSLVHAFYQHQQPQERPI